MGLMKIKAGGVTVTKGIKLNTYVHKEVIIDSNVTGLSTTGQQGADPCIVWDSVNKRWLIYFFANVGGHSETYVAESRDLLHVKLLGKAISIGPSGSFDENHAEKPSVIYYNNKYYLFYSGVNSANYRAIGLATSDNGINFTKYANNPILTDPEGTSHGIEAPSVIRWKDGNFYMWAYNGNGKNLVFRTTPDNFPLGWTQIGTLESRFFGIYSVEAFYDDEIDKILLLAGIFYPKPTPPQEPARTGYLALFAGDEPLKLTYHGVLLPSLPRDTRSYPLRYFNQNVFASGIAKVGSGKYVVLLNGTEDGTIAAERIFRMDLGVDTEQTLHIINTYTTSTNDEKIGILRLPPGTKAVLKHAMIYVYSGSPSELYIADGQPAADADNVIAWTNTSRLELTREVVINGGYLVLCIKGTAPISLAYSFEVVIKPAIDEI